LDQVNRPLEQRNNLAGAEDNAEDGKEGESFFLPRLTNGCEDGGVQPAIRFSGWTSPVQGFCDSFGSSVLQNLVGLQLFPGHPIRKADVFFLMHHWHPFILLQVVKFLDSHASATLCQLFVSVCSTHETLGGDSKGVGRLPPLARETAQAHAIQQGRGIYGALDRSIKVVD
jgi:hypothetical protein